MIMRPATGPVRDVLVAVRKRLAPFEHWAQVGLCVAVSDACGKDERLRGLVTSRLEQAIGYGTTVAAWAEGHNHASTLALLDLTVAGSGQDWLGAAPLEAAADLVGEALKHLNTAYTGCTCCGTRRWHNEEHARLYDQLSGVPEKLRKAAQRGADTAKVDNGKAAAHVRPQEGRDA